MLSSDIQNMRESQAMSGLQCAQICRRCMGGRKSIQKSQCIKTRRSRRSNTCTSFRMRVCVMVRHLEHGDDTTHGGRVFLNGFHVPSCRFLCSVLVISSELDIIKTSKFPLRVSEGIGFRWFSTTLAAFRTFF